MTAELINGKQALHCANCDKPTYLRSVAHDVPMCSIECAESFDGEVERTVKEASEWFKRYY